MPIHPDLLTATGRQLLLLPARHLKVDHRTACWQVAFDLVRIKWRAEISTIPIVWWLSKNLNEVRTTKVTTATAVTCVVPAIPDCCRTAAKLSVFWAERN